MEKAIHVQYLFILRFTLQDRSCIPLKEDSITMFSNQGIIFIVYLCSMHLYMMKETQTRI